MATMTRQISIPNDFTPFPGGRYRKNGKGSGEEFRERFLLPVFREDGQATIVLDGASGYPPSFLEEAFGGLVREGFTETEIRQRISIKATPSYEPYSIMIWNYVAKASKSAPKHGNH